jgi:UDP-N-acetylmuramate dehydrogenase
MFWRITQVTVTEQVLLADYTTLRLGGPAARFVSAGTEEELIAAVRAADEDGEPVLVLGGGSNLVVADDGFPGAVVQVATAGVERAAAGDGDAVELSVAAGEDWDGLVQRCVADGLSGVECLAGIPGRTGATPIQNVGAYGQEVAQTITSVRAYDRVLDRVVTLSRADCGFGYRTSMFKRRATARPGAGLNPAAATGRYVVLTVTFRLAADPLSAPVRYAELARVLGVPEGGRVPLADARAAVLGLRRGKGMVLDPDDPDTRSAGSFFTNPVLPAAQFAELTARVAAGSAGAVLADGGPADGGLADRGPADGGPGGAAIPHWDEGPGEVKVPAAWLIERAGFTKGYPGAGPARISAKHTLALTNAGGSSTAELIRLARQVRDGVFDAFGVRLVNEPTLVGIEL